MARINVEDKLFNDVRFIKLTHELGTNRSVGAVVNLWKLAQVFWGQGRKNIPEHLFLMLEDYEALLKYFFAEKREGGYYAFGSEEHFGWYESKVTNGKKGGRPTKLQLLNKTETKPNDNLNNPPSPSPSLAPTPTLTHKNKKERNKEEGKAIAEATAPQTINLKIHGIVKGVFDQYRKYNGEGATPSMTVRERGMIRTLLADYSEQYILQMYETYLQMEDPWFLKRAFDFGTFYTNLTKIRNAMESGKPELQRGRGLKPAEQIIKEQEMERTRDEWNQASLIENSIG